MPLPTTFSYKAPSSVSYKTPIVDAGGMPEFMPYGVSERGPDGTLVFVDAPSRTVVLPAIGINRKPDGTAGPVGCAVELYAEYRLCLNSDYGTLMIVCYDPISGSMKEYYTKPDWPDYSGRTDGGVLVGLSWRFKRVVETGVQSLSVYNAYSGGPFLAPSSDTDVTGGNTEAEGDPYAGTYGWGYYGRGRYGIGSDSLT